MLAGGWLPLPDPTQIKKSESDLSRRMAKLLRKNPERIATLELGPESNEMPES